MRLTFSLLLLILSRIILAQPPALIPYQAIARNSLGDPLVNSTLNARFTIHDGTATGTSVWQEMQTVSTSALGLFTVQLGSSISLANVNWVDGAKFMQVEVDLGSGFVDIGTQQLLSVPFALHSYTADNAIACGDGISHVSATGDSLFLNNGTFFILPGISESNHSSNGGGGGSGGTSTGTTLHTCGAPNVHNPDLTYGSMTDQEGNVYKTIVIGSQEWMAENLNTSIYRNGDAIPTGLSDAEWSTTNTGAWSIYNNDPSYVCPRGKLYNWYTCVDSRGLCPNGWHVPSHWEWYALTDFLGGEAGAGVKMRSIGIWAAPNTEANNISGFSGVPGGLRFIDPNSPNNYYNISEIGFWWSTTSQDNGAFAWYRGLRWINLDVLNNGHYKNQGNSVRCLRD